MSPIAPKTHAGSLRACHSLKITPKTEMISPQDGGQLGSGMDGSGTLELV